MYITAHRIQAYAKPQKIQHQETWGIPSKAMFVSRKIVFKKPFSKLSCVCLPLQKLVNGKHFPVNGNTFRSMENTFQSKKNLIWFPGKCFPFWLCLFSGKWFPGNHFPNFPVFVCHQKSWSTENTFQSKKNLA